MVKFNSGGVVPVCSRITHMISGKEENMHSQIKDPLFSAVNASIQIMHRLEKVGRAVGPAVTILVVAPTPVAAFDPLTIVTTLSAWKILGGLAGLLGIGGFIYVNRDRVGVAMHNGTVAISDAIITVAKATVAIIKPMAIVIIMFLVVGGILCYCATDIIKTLIISNKELIMFDKTIDMTTTVVASLICITFLVLSYKLFVNAGAGAFAMFEHARAERINAQFLVNKNGANMQVGGANNPSLRIGAHPHQD